MYDMPTPWLNPHQFTSYAIEKFRPKPTLSWGASWSQFSNGIADWFSFYRSEVRKIDMNIDSKPTGYNQAQKIINSVKRAGEFFQHPYHYKYDKDTEDEWLTPKDFYRRWADFPEEYWPWRVDIADDCEGTAWFAHHCIRVANKVSVDSIKKDFQNGKRNNVIGCCYDDKSGHAYNVHGQWTVGNWGRIDHGHNDPVVIAKDFISGSNWISFYVENEAGNDIEYLEGAEINYYKNVKRMSVEDHISIMAEEDEEIKYGMLTGEHMDEICSQIRKFGNVLQVPEDIFKKYGLPAEPIRRGLEAEINGRGPIVKKIAKQVKVPIKKLASPIEVKFVA